MLVKVDCSIFLVDFVILDMKEDVHVTLILGRPFLAKGEAMINVKKGELKLSFNHEEVTFSIFKSLSEHDEVESCDFIDVVDNLLPNEWENFSNSYLSIDTSTFLFDSLKMSNENLLSTCRESRDLGNKEEVHNSTTSRTSGRNTREN